MIKQYVNLPVKAADHHGSRAKLTATASSLGPGKMGISEWWVEPTGSNTDLKYLSAKQRTRPQKSYVCNKKDQFKNVIVLTHVGGDKYKVKCSKQGDRSSAFEVEEIETWRKFFYTVHWMNAACKATFEAVKTRFEDAFKLAFIEVEKSADSQTLVDEPRTLAKKAHLPHLYNKKPELKDKPFHLRLVVVNDLYDIERATYEDIGSGKVFDIPTNAPLSDLARYPWLIRARARVDPGGRWVSIQTYVTTTGPNTIHVDLTTCKPLAKAIDNGQTVQTEVNVRVRSHYCGHSIGNFVVVRVNEPGTPADAEITILQTFTHEIGHGCQQTVRRERLYKPNGSRDGKKFENNPSWHDDDYGGQGPHCHTNATKAADPDTDSGFTYEGGAGTLCTMFFRADPDVDSAGKFCVECEPRLKRVNLNGWHMRQQGWDWY